MIISPKRRFAFVHIPKTGGTSFAHAYDDRAAADDILIGDSPKAKRRKGRLAEVETPGRLWKHSKLCDVGALIPPDFFVVTLVRNPWDWMVSYYHWLQDRNFVHPAVTRAKALEFPQFIRDPLIQSACRVSPARSYVTRAEGQLQCDLFARLEVPSDLAALWDYLGFELTVPHLNRSNRAEDWRMYYADEDIEIIAEIAAEDIAQFGYRPE